jgi:hypothetical protein
MQPRAGTALALALVLHAHALGFSTRLSFEAC